MLQADRKYFVISCLFHLGVLLLFIIGFDAVSPMVVVENTHKTDVISAVVLGDTKQSKILPQEKPLETQAPVEKQKPLPAPAKPIEKPTEKLEVKKKPEPPKPDEIALKKKLEKKKQRELLAKNLLSDLKKKQVVDNKKSQKALKVQFEKTLRDQLLLDDIKMKGTQSRQASGIVNKYQALIIQAISEHWVIPPGANKKLYSLLLIRLASDGSVLDVQVTRSSGDLSLDSSARAAVFKASPLPVPKKPDDFAPFKQFTLKVKPETVLSADAGMTS